MRPDAPCGLLVTTPSAQTARVVFPVRRGVAGRNGASRAPVSSACRVAARRRTRSSSPIPVSIRWYETGSRTKEAPFPRLSEKPVNAMTRLAGRTRAGRPLGAAASWRRSAAASREDSFHDEVDSIRGRAAARARRRTVRIQPLVRTDWSPASSGARAPRERRPDVLAPLERSNTACRYRPPTRELPGRHGRIQRPETTAGAIRPPLS
jgi:hypothetical protein